MIDKVEIGKIYQIPQMRYITITGILETIFFDGKFQKFYKFFELEKPELESSMSEGWLLRYCHEIPNGG